MFSQETPLAHHDKVAAHTAVSKPRKSHTRRYRLFWIPCIIFLIVAIALGVGLGVGLNQGGGGSKSSPSTTPLPPVNSTNATTGNFWRPVAGTSWQIVLNDTIQESSLNVSVYDIDLFINSAQDIQQLHGQGRRVICYFSAGSYEDYRPDSAQFLPSDKGHGLDGWPGEYWLNTTSSNVRRIMTARMAFASQQGCDGVDPDNVDAYDNDNGLGLTQADAVDYLTFLAIGAHRLNLSIGLKNAGAIVPTVIDMMQWEVNEQCVQYEECSQFTPFITAGKPVFHIEYPDGTPSVSSATRSKYCDDPSEQGFSTILKDMDLGEWVMEC